MRRSWLTKLEPVAAQSVASAVLAARADELTALLGPGPAGWAVELGATMAGHITAAIPAHAALRLPVPPRVVPAGRSPR